MQREATISSENEVFSPALLAVLFVICINQHDGSFFQQGFTAISQ
jgi:hypothetical protein